MGAFVELCRTKLGEMPLLGFGEFMPGDDIQQVSISDACSRISCAKSLQNTSLSAQQDGGCW